MKRVKLPELYLETMASILRRKTGSSARMTPRQMLSAANGIATSGDPPVIITYEEIYSSSFTEVVMQVRNFESHFSYDEPNYYSSCEEIT